MGQEAHQLALVSLNQHREIGQGAHQLALVYIGSVLFPFLLNKVITIWSIPCQITQWTTPHTLQIGSYLVYRAIGIRVLGIVAIGDHGNVAIGDHEIVDIGDHGKVIS